MNIFVLGSNFKIAEVELREKLIVPDEFLQKLKQFDEIKEIVFLSTCNRVEFYGVSEEPNKAINTLYRELSNYSQISLEKLKKHTYTFTGLEGIKHIFTVASSLDSMVIGEPQIVKQFKDAFIKGKKLGTVGYILSRIGDKAINVSKKIRTNTDISKKAVSISYVAIELAKKIFDTLEDKVVLLIGAGEMAELAARHLVSKKVKHIFISNRTFEKAVELANEFGGSTIRFEKLYEFLPEADIIIVSTGAKEPILRKEHFKDVIKKRKGKPIFIIDISVPRNVSDDVNELDNVYLYNIDDLKSVAEKNYESRKLSAERGKLIIEKEALKFYKWLKQQKVYPLIANLKEFSNNIVDYQLEQLFKQMPYLTDKERENIRLMVNAVVKKILHRPITYLKNKASNDENDRFIDEFENMFLKGSDNLNKFLIKKFEKGKNEK
ncbi:MAG: glutamyl-tRNA reductase [Persephonella sp.]|nr:MAG: glutamyl-tRNA reductase [Persephonella sp.]RUM61645.1 MAG: glutamyl-tRNA reductase [Persephonella sp.]